MGTRGCRKAKQKLISRMTRAIMVKGRITETRPRSFICRIFTSLSEMDHSKRAHKGRRTHKASGIFATFADCNLLSTLLTSFAFVCSVHFICPMLPLIPRNGRRPNPLPLHTRRLYVFPPGSACLVEVDL